jgi:peptidoglycan hydrolase-like protein with peptidoglycan-binding domain
MALRSNLFSGDAQLEAAAVTPSAHIMLGARGPHVAKLQYALAVLTGEPLSFDGAYGPRTAAAALAFKTARDIVNRSYQQTPDDIVGIMTMAALDAEMAACEQSGDSTLVTCQYRKKPQPARDANRRLVQRWR